MFKITNDWLMNNRTKNGGWTKKQFVILGLSWPQKSGWKGSLIGCSITNTDRVNFESAAHITCKTKKPEVLRILQDKLKRAYCEKIGSDSIVGLDSCDNYKDWLLNLGRK